MFNAIASRYDAINRILSFGLDRRWRRALIPLLPDLPSIRLLDIATGTGDQIGALLSDCRIVSATGIDIADQMLELARAKFQASNRVVFQEGDALSLPFGDGSFEAVTIAFGIRNVSNPQAALKEIRRVTASGGRALVLEFSMPVSPILPLYRLYLRHVLPRVGRVLSGHRDAYRYLNQTIESFPSGEKFAVWMRDAGFREVSIHPMTAGTVTLYVGSP